MLEQEIIVGLICLVAVLFVGRKFYKTVSGKGGCGCGGKCPSKGLAGPSHGCSGCGTENK